MHHFLMFKLSAQNTYNKAHHSLPAAAGTSNANAFFRPCALRFMALMYQHLPKWPEYRRTLNKAPLAYDC